MLAMTTPDALLRGSYDYRLVALSILIAMLASYAALDLAGRVTSARGAARAMWLSGGAAAMGMGIWSMHYVGMLALRLPVVVEYDWPTVLLSLLAAILASAIALFVASRKTLGMLRAMLGSFFMGGAIASMHYIGMAAMRLPAMCRYNPALVALSVALAMIISLVALLLTFHLRGEMRSASWQKVAAAMVMGAAVPVMHYTGMAAASFEFSRAAESGLAHALSISALGTIGIIVVTFMVLGLTVLTSVVDRRFSVQALELESSERRSRQILETSFDAFVGIRPDGTIRDWNLQAQETFGWRRAEVIGKVFREIIVPDRCRETFEEEIRSLVTLRDGAKTNRFETIAIRSDGLEIPAEITISAVGNAQGHDFAAFIRDLTERKRFEQDLRKAKEAAEGANEAKSSFLATMSHEIRTPMNGILGMTELVLDTELTTEQREHLGLVHLSAESLLSIINDILDFSKIEAGKFELETIPFDLRESLGETMKVLSFRAHQKGLELVYDVQPEVAETLLGDPGRIRQILINLIGNAVKFTAKGEIVIRVEEQSHTNDTVVLHFAVRDTGVGVPAEKQETIFEAFSQADGSMARKYGGTGLGLTICKRLVELMNGRIWLESQPGVGSTFHFTISLGVQDSFDARNLTPSSDELRDIEVLVVDDNFTNRCVLGGMLARWCMRTVAVEGGREGLQALQAAKNAGHPFQLILLDGQMPDMDGFSLAEIIHKDPTLVGATVMMLTSAGHMGDAARCRELGIGAYMVKPVRQRELLETICALTQQGRKVKIDPLVTRHKLREDRNRRRVLLAEDNAVNQKLAQRLLEKRGFEVTIAGDGRAALQALEKESFDIVLMDVQMPDLDGIAATVAIREREILSGGHVPIIAMTAHALKGDEERCMAAGMDGYVTKPIRTVELFAAIDKILSRATIAGEIQPIES
jgi:two-component system sensor histidine kinase/response regulator